MLWNGWPPTNKKKKKKDWLVLSPYCPRDSQESSPEPQSKSITSLALIPFMVWLSHLYMTTGKTTTLTIQTFVGKVMSLSNMLPRFVIAFLLRSKHLLILWLHSLSAVILVPKKIKSATVSTFPIYISPSKAKSGSTSKTGVTVVLNLLFREGPSFARPKQTKV